MREYFIKMCKAIYNRNSKKEDIFRKSVFLSNKEEFYVLEGLNDFSLEIGNILDRYISEIEKPCLQFALIRIHEKSVKILKECIILMQNGSASGAMARWRTLYEFSVIANYLVKHPELSEKYINYIYVDDYNMSEKLVRFKERLNLDNLNADTFQSIEKNHDNVLEKNEWSGSNKYEWANCNEIKKANLFFLAKNVGLEHLYAYVDESHLYIHPSMKFLINERGTNAPNDKNKYLFTPFDMERPFQLCTISMFQVNYAVMRGYGLLKTADLNQLERYFKQNSEFPEYMIEIIKNRQACSK